MTGHEWIDWAIKATQEGKLSWDTTLKHDDVHGDYYLGKYQSSSPEEKMVYVFSPRKNKDDAAVVKRYWDVDPKSLEGNVPPWKADYVNKVVSTKNFVPGFGYLCNNISNSKVYKLEKYIVGVKATRITYSSPSRAGQDFIYRVTAEPEDYTFEDVFNLGENK